MSETPPQARRHPLITGVRITSVGTLASRVLGMCRDMATAALLGLAGGGVADAFVIAYRLPNLFRRLFGEGALTASYLPVLAAHLERDRTSAWQLASVALTWLAVLLAAIVVVGEGMLALLWWIWGTVPGVGLLVGLSAFMLPYLLLICLAAQATATLHTLSHFTVPALVPVVLNVCWLLAAWMASSWFDDPVQQAYVLAVGVLVAGVLQLGVQVPVLYRLGFRFDYNWAASRAGLGQIGRALTPMLVGLAVTQINTFLDSLIAWGLAAPPGPDGPQPIAWLGGAVHYPLDQGAAAAIYYGERLYQFPLGVLGAAVAAAIFPLLARHAARGDRVRLGADLSLGLRLVLCLGVPASVGLILLAQPLASLLFEHGQFTADDTLRTARMIVCYGSGVWAFCALLVVVRAFYAMSDAGAPARVAAWTVILNFSLNLALIWTPLEEAGLAVATSVSALVQLALLMRIFSRHEAPLDWTALGATTIRAVGCTLLMAAVGYASLNLAGRLTPGAGLTDRFVRVLLPLVSCVAVYVGSYWLSRGRELALLLGGGVEPTDEA